MDHIDERMRGVDLEWVGNDSLDDEPSEFPPLHDLPAPVDKEGENLIDSYFLNWLLWFDVILPQATPAELVANRIHFSGSC